ncbi:MAG: AMP-binding protein, partial [Lachnospiraceae bacterium]|nr:AMP-binding protein [Lachnospiraceae bacterium]
MIWAKEETLPRAELEKLQLERLKETVRYIYEKVAPYREKMDNLGVKPEDIQTLSDLQRLPFTNKSDFRENYPTGLFAVDKKDLVRVHASSGTTGKPTIVGYTKKDMDIWINNVSRIACMGGASKEDIVQLSFGYGMFTGALGLHMGLENIGAAVMPMSSGNTQKQIMYLQDMEPTILVATPSYALHLGEEIRAMGLDPQKDLKIKIGLFGGEGMTEPMRNEMHKVWGEDFLCTQNYGMSELSGPGVSGECEQLCGMH